MEPCNKFDYTLIPLFTGLWPILRTASDSSPESFGLPLRHSYVSSSRTVWVGGTVVAVGAFTCGTPSNKTTV